MKTKRFNEEQIMRILEQAQAGMKIADLCGRHHISDAIYITDARSMMPRWTIRNSIVQNQVEGMRCQP
ncbi:Transposase [Desulfopila aestuarii DSM 18488]|uniref:Transposase n=2 Tax=Desulfopila aestuarii TaxID=231440 RepID=A0A1M7YKE1_9BACT|nr:Transposase [Desulfopila aestuarii DSM 18488]